MTGDTLLFMMGSLGRLVKRTFDRNLRSVGLTFVQISALTFLEGHDGANQKEIEEYLKLTRATVSAMMDSLAEQDLVVRERDESDGRAWHIFITEEGRKRVENARMLSIEMEKKLSAALADDEKEQYMRISQKLKNVLEEKTC